MRAFPVFFMSLVLCFSCSPEETCDERMESLLVARFKTVAPVSDTIITGITIYGIDETGSRGIIDPYDSAQISRVLLPLDVNGNQSRFVLTAGGEADTLEIRHENEVYLVSYACGFAVRHTLTAITPTGQMIDSAVIIAPVVDAEMLNDEEHIWIYF